ncbi:MAG: hypothetical protein RLP15_05335 [Cryomorphaceae bacterium]
MNWARVNTIALVAVLLYLFAEIALLFLTPRNETVQLLTVYFALCGAYLVLYQEVRSIQSAAFLGVMFRIIAWLAFPTLSDDLYRFIWDGAVTLEGVSPYAFTPSEFFKNNLHSPFEQLFPMVNSSAYYSVYPAVIQVISAFGALASNDIYLSSLVIKLPLLLAEIATIWMLPKVLLNFNISPKYSVLYMLNPLLIVDVLGNAHFEALMIFFVVLCLKLIQDKSYTLAGAALALSVATKLFPLIMIPFLWKAFKDKDRIQFMVSFASISLLLFLPVYYSLTHLMHYLESLNLYFQHFEFNASIYYIFRLIGNWLVGYNPVAFIGPMMGALTLLIASYIWFKQPREKLSDALRSVLWVSLAYYLLATTVHPWYISFLIIMGIFSRKPFAVIWSVVIFVSYSAYENSIYDENFILITLEYGILALAILYPRFTRKLIVSPIRNL